MPEISEEERERRKKAIDFARGSVRFEGFILDDESEALAARFVSGDLTMEQFISEGRFLAGLAPELNSAAEASSPSPGIKED